MKPNPQPLMRMVCDGCGAEQEPDQSRSNANWKVYTANAECECGGTFRLVLCTPEEAENERGEAKD